MTWSTQDRIDEVQFHINGLRSLILGNALSPHPCPEIQRNLSFALGILRDHRERLVSQLDESQRLV